MIKLNLQYFAEGVEIEYEGEISNLPIGKQARFACKDKSMPSDIVIKNKGVGEISGVTVTKDKVLEGETFYGSNGLEEGTMPNNGYVDGDFGATLDLNLTELLLNGAYRGSVTIYPQEVTIVPSDVSQEISPADGCVFGKVKVEKIPPTDTWDGTGVVIAPIEPVEPNTFKINGISYQMENRMTWYAWTRSEYNTDGFACANENDYVYEAESSNKVTDADGNDVLGTTYIVEGGAYLIKEAVSLISFTIDGTSYQAEEGMTWAEWVASKYNTNGVKIDSLGNVLTSSGLRIATAQYSGAQRSTDIIVANKAYIIQMGGGAD